MEHLPSSSQKRSLPEDSLHPSPETSLPLSDHQTKRLRRTLPPISLSQQTSTSFPNSFQLPIPPTLLDSNPPSLSLPPISATDSPVMPIPSPRSLTGQQHHELPPINSLGPLPPIPRLSSNYNSMSISSILSNSDHDPFIRKLDMNIKEMGVGSSTNVLNRSHNPLDFHTHPPSLLNIDRPVNGSECKVEVVNGVTREANDLTNNFNEDADEQENSGDDNTPDPHNDCKSDNEESENSDDNDIEEFSLDRSLFEGLNLQRETHLIIKNDDTLNMEGREERHLGHLIYNPKEILPPLEFHENGLLEVWIPSKHLTWENMKVRNRFLWGTDVYTDDSDIVAVLIHTGLYNPPPQKSKWSSNQPDHDLCVTIRVLPKLVQYTATVRNKYQSRSWGNHHGVSYKIEKVCEMKNGEAIGRSIGKGRKERLRKFHQMRKRAFKDPEYRQNDDSILVFNNEGDPCYKYNPLIMENDEDIKKRLKKEVMYLENDDERYEVSYDEASDKYRFAIVLSATNLGLSAVLRDQEEANVSLPCFPLAESQLEIFRDDLDFHEMAWNIVGVIVADKTNPLHSLLCISKRVFWRERTLP